MFSRMTMRKIKFIRMTLSSMTFRKLYSKECYLTEWHLTEWHLTEWHLTEWHLTEWRLTEWHLTEWHLTECHLTVDKMTLIRMTFDRMTLIRMTLIRMTFDRITHSIMTLNRCTIKINLLIIWERQKIYAVLLYVILLNAMASLHYNCTFVSLRFFTLHKMSKCKLAPKSLKGTFQIYLFDIYFCNVLLGLSVAPYLLVYF